MEIKHKRVKIKTITTNEKGDLIINGRPELDHLLDLDERP